MWAMLPASFPWRFRSVRLLSPTAKCPEGPGKLCPNCAQLVHWGLTGKPWEGLVELCVGDFLIESVHNPRKYMKNIVFLTFGFYQPPSQNWFSFFLRISSQRGAQFWRSGILSQPQLWDLRGPASQWRAAARHDRTTDSEWGLATSPLWVVCISMQNIDVFERAVNFAL